MRKLKLRKLKLKLRKFKLEKLKLKKLKLRKLKLRKNEIETTEIQKIQIQKMEIEKIGITIEKIKIEKIGIEIDKTVIAIEQMEINKIEIEKMEIEKIEIEKMEIEKIEIEKENYFFEKTKENYELTVKHFLVAHWLNIFSVVSMYPVKTSKLFEKSNFVFEAKPKELRLFRSKSYQIHPLHYLKFQIIADLFRQITPKFPPRFSQPEPNFENKFRIERRHNQKMHHLTPGLDGRPDDTGNTENTGGKFGTN